MNSWRCANETYVNLLFYTHALRCSPCIVFAFASSLVILFLYLKCIDLTRLNSLRNASNEHLCGVVFGKWIYIWCKRICLNAWIIQRGFKPSSMPHKTNPRRGAHLFPQSHNIMHCTMEKPGCDIFQDQKVASKQNRVCAKYLRFATRIIIVHTIHKFKLLSILYSTKNTAISGKPWLSNRHMHSSNSTITSGI